MTSGNNPKIYSKNKQDIPSIFFFKSNFEEAILILKENWYIYLANQFLCVSPVTCFTTYEDLHLTSKITYEVFPA